jgi:predicted AlkP superfamily pyrophosphatase or phosphodiesterase
MGDIKIAVILLDAFRFDYLSKKNMPFFWNLSKKANITKLNIGINYLNYAQIFSGTYPETNNQWTLFYFDPYESPFKQLNHMKHLPTVISDNHKFRGLLSKLLKKTSNNNIIKHYGDVYNIPFNVIRNFNISLNKLIYERNSLEDIKTLFDVLRENNLKFDFIAPPIYNTRAQIINYFNRINLEETDFLFMHFPELDHVGHEYGTNSIYTRIELKNLDKILKFIVENTTKKYKNVTFLIFSDHGMNDIHNTVNVDRILRKEGIVPGESFTPFYDSTLARFWFNNSDLKRKVYEVLSKVKSLTYMGEEHTKRLKIRFKDNRYGDMIFVAKEGFIISPNFFQGDRIVKGMHGYLSRDDCVDDAGLFLLHSPTDDFQVCQQNGDLSSIFPTILDILELDILKTCEGKSLIR